MTPTTMTRKELVNALFLKNKWSDQKWQEKTGLSRQTFWRLRKKSDAGIESKTIDLMAKAAGVDIKWTDYTKRKASFGEEAFDGKGDPALLEQIVRNQLSQIDSLNTLTKMQSERISELEAKLTAIQENPQHMLETISLNMTKALDFHDIATQIDVVQNNWNTLFYNTTQPMSVAKDGRFVNVNKALCSLIGYTESEMIGKHVCCLIHEDDLDEANKMAESRLTSKKVSSVFKVMHKDGNYYPMEVSVSEFGNNSKDNAPYTIAMMRKPKPKSL